jgi:DNA-binding transcriptional LysR family regulator
MIRIPSLRVLELFATLMRTRSLTMTARCIGISQPAASLALKELEAQTGFRLFTRERQRMVPTAEAKSLLVEVEQLLAQADVVHRQIEALQASSVGAMRVASILSVSGTLLPSVISGFQRVQPGISIRIEVQPYAGVLELVRHEAVELGFINLPEEGAEQSAEPLLTTSLSCLMSPDHPLATRKSVSLEALKRHTTIFTAHGELPPSLLRARVGIDAGWGSAGGIEVNNTYTAIALAREGIGVALLNPLVLLNAQADGLVGREMEAQVPLALAMVAPRQARMPAVSDLIAQAHKAARHGASRLREMGLHAEAA